MISLHAYESVGERIVNDAFAALHEANFETLLRAVAIPGGFQEAYGAMPGFELWTLTRDIPGHPKGSTVTKETIRRALVPSYGKTTVQPSQDFQAIEKP